MVVAVSFITCNDAEKKENPADAYNQIATQYVGGSQCISCHKEIYESHIASPHYNTSALATEAIVKGSFSEERNSYRFSNRTIVKCEKDKGKLYQVAYVDSVEKIRQEFDIVFGYGKNAQSFAAWSKNKLVQLPLSYFSSGGQWINSPGYPDKVVFNRVITSRCLECHTTYAEVSSSEGLLENFNRSNIVLGIDCEKCHGPAAAHVRFMTENPAEKDEKYIINNTKFSRQQRLDACALCHSGNMDHLQPSFSFRPGDELEKFYASGTTLLDVEKLDVHGNQYGLLTASKCFTLSQMTCGSCHDPHKNELRDVITFSQRCMVCHSPENKKKFCSLTGIGQSFIEQNCIDCHMPEQESATIVFSDYETGGKSSAKMRTHFVSIYPEETQKIISFLKKNSKAKL